MQVLLIEDEAINLQLGTIVLTNLGCSVDTATTGSEALNMVQKKKYDVIFLDLGLPDFDGFEVAEKIKLTEINSNAPIIVVTGHGAGTHKDRSIAAGASGFITKPLLAETAKKILEEHCCNKKHPENCLIIENMKLFHESKRATESVIKGIFKKNYISINSNKADPYIIDCGSHIGISVLFFKLKYPNSKILAFEPNPISFAILQKNIEVNALSDITLINKAVYTGDGFQHFFGEINAENSDSRGNSLICEWGKQLEYHHEQTLVETVKLSSYINHEVDFLKLDIEGAEQLVLEELGDKLNMVQEMSIEVHQSSKIAHFNSLDKIIEILKRYNFETTVEKHEISFLANSKKAWAEKNQPSVFMVHATKTSKNE